MLTPAAYVTTPGGWGQEAGCWDRAHIENFLDIHFQNGPMQTHGVNGVELIDVLKVCRDFAHALSKVDGSRDRSHMIARLDEAIMWERRRAETDNTRERAAERAARRA